MCVFDLSCGEKKWVYEVPSFGIIVGDNVLYVGEKQAVSILDKRTHKPHITLKLEEFEGLNYCFDLSGNTIAVLNSRACFYFLDIRMPKSLCSLLDPNINNYDLLDYTNKALVGLEFQGNEVIFAYADDTFVKKMTFKA